MYDFLRRYWMLLELLAALMVIVIHLSRAEGAPGGTSTPESLRLIRPGYVYASQQITADSTHDISSEVAVNELLLLICTVDVRYDQGGASVEASATDSYLPANMPLWLRSASGYTYVSVERAGSVDGICTLTVFR